MEYNGHKTRQHWNVALWINNDEGLYRLALDCLSDGRTFDHSVRLFLDRVGTEETPDRVKWTRETVAAALTDLIYEEVSDVA